jgi:ubiquinone/menaquinone biosynthesis C-methylase UbiE
MKSILTRLSSSGSGDETASHYEDFFGPFYFEPYAIEVAKRIDPGSIGTVLEIAAGTGRVTRHIRKRIFDGANLIASDIDENMLAIAKKKLLHLDIDWQIIDAQQLPFDDNSIDTVICCFGYMFVPDKPKAFAEAFRVLKPGSQFLFTTWDKLENNGASFISSSIADEYLEERLTESDNLATSMSDETVITPLLHYAGFKKILIEKVKLFSSVSTAKEAAQGFVQGIIYENIKKRNPTAIEEIKMKLEKKFAEKFGAAPMTAPISAVISQAWK